MQQKLAYLCGTTSWGGLEMNQLRNAKWMQESGVEVIILAQSISPIYENALKENIPVQAIQAHKNHFDIFKAFKVYLLIKKLKITHLIVRSTFDQSIAATVKAWRGKKLTTAYFQEMQITKVKKQWYRALRYYYLDFWISPSSYLLEQTKQNIRINSEKLHLIYSGIDKPKFVEKKVCRQKFKLSEKCFLFGILGRIDEKKGQLLLLQALIQSKNENYQILIVGEPTRNEKQTYFEELTEFIEKNDLSDRVHIKNYLQETEYFYNAIDCLILPSLSESFGMVTVEALSHGIPVIGSNAGSTPELLAYGEIGELFETQNSEDLSKKMNFIASENHKFIPQKIKSYSKKFSKEKTIQNVRQLLSIA